MTNGLNMSVILVDSQNNNNKKYVVKNVKNKVSANKHKTSIKYIFL